MALTIVYPGLTFGMHHNEYDGLCELFTEIEKIADWDVNIPKLSEAEKEQSIKLAQMELIKNAETARQILAQKNRGPFLEALVHSFMKNHKQCSRDSIKYGVQSARLNIERVRKLSQSFSRLQSFAAHLSDTNQNTDLIKKLKDISEDQIIEISNSK